MIPNKRKGASIQGDEDYNPEDDAGAEDEEENEEDKLHSGDASDAANTTGSGAGESAGDADVTARSEEGSAESADAGSGESAGGNADATAGSEEGSGESAGGNADATAGGGENVGAHAQGGNSAFATSTPVRNNKRQRQAWFCAELPDSYSGGPARKLAERHTLKEQSPLLVPNTRYGSRDDFELAVCEDFEANKRLPKRSGKRPDGVRADFWDSSSLPAIASNLWPLSAVTELVPRVYCK